MRIKLKSLYCRIVQRGS